MTDYKTKVLIIGSGPAGYTAGIYAARAGLNPIIVSGNQIGGQLTITTEIENFPGFPEPIEGTDLMAKMRQQAQNVGVTLVDDTITNVETIQYPFQCTSENNNTYTADTIIIATGATARWLGLESEKKFIGFGVSGCATCDGFFYRGKNVVVVGGGNTAAEEALYLTNFAQSVTLIHRRNELRADKLMQERLFNNPKITIEWDSIVEEIKGELPQGVNGIILKNVKTEETKELKTDGVFIAIGHHPNTDLFKDKLELNNEGYIITKPDSCQTSIKGIFAAGDVKNPNFRQAVVAAGSGCIAALEAEKFLSK